LKLPLEQNFMAIGLAGLIGAAAVTLINQTRADSHRSNSVPVVAVQGSAGR
jgi:AAHS family benzoate transporter-like MFS transporter